MNASEAFNELLRMDVLGAPDMGGYWAIEKVPRKRDLDALVRAIKVLGAHSVALPHTPASVEVVRGFRPNELRFRLVRENRGN